MKDKSVSKTRSTTCSRQKSKIEEIQKKKKNNKNLKQKTKIRKN